MSSLSSESEATQRPAPCPVRRRLAGFTLVELMVVVLIIGVLLAIALPSYRAYLVKANRAAAKAVLVEVVSRQEQYAASNRAYAGNLAALGLTLPAEVASNYTVSITPQTWTSGTATMSGFTVAATPVAGSPQADDGELKINQFGLRSPVDKW